MSTQSLVMVFLSIVLVGCASGPTYQQQNHTLSEVDTDKARMYFYRTAVMGGVVQPEVRLDGHIIGFAQPKGYFYVDKPPGEYRISVKTEKEFSITVNLKAGEVKYFSLEPRLGAFVGNIEPVPVEVSEGEEEIKGTNYIGDTIVYDCEAETVPPAEATRIIIYRTLGFVGLAVPTQISIDRCRAGAVKANSYQVYLLNPGVHRVAPVGPGNSWVESEFEKGKTYYLRQIVGLANFKIELTDKETAVSKMAKLKKIGEIAD